MENQRIMNILYKQEASGVCLLSPAAGIYAGYPRKGTYLSEESPVGSLKILNSVYRLFLPPGINGYVVSIASDHLSFPVGYGQELFRLDTRSIDLNRFQEKGSGDGTDLSATRQKDETGFIIRAFTNGIFYTKPAPDAKPFVKLGQKIEKGKALGLIEVMKTFNHIVFTGTGTSDSGTVKRIYVEDAAEVKEGDPIFLID